jgi:hypothetical protein
MYNTPIIEIECVRCHKKENRAVRGKVPKYCLACYKIVGREQARARILKLKETVNENSNR